MITVVTDVHAHILALQTALEKIRELENSHNSGQRSLRVCLGDVLDAGPLPVETLKLLLSEFDVFLRGNHEDYVFEHSADVSLQKYHDPLWKMVPWAAQKLGKEAVLDFQKRCVFDWSAPNSRVHFYHASAGSNASAPAFFPSQNRSSVVGGSSVTIPDQAKKIVAVGHTHYFGHHWMNSEFWINSGSLGYPFVDRVGHDPLSSASTFVTIHDYSSDPQRSQVAFHTVEYSSYEFLRQCLETGFLEECLPFSVPIVCQTLFNQDITFPFFRKAKKIGWSQEALPEKLVSELEQLGYVDRLQRMIDKIHGRWDVSSAFRASARIGNSVLIFGVIFIIDLILAAAYPQGVHPNNVVDPDGVVYLLGERKPLVFLVETFLTPRAYGQSTGPLPNTHSLENGDNLEKTASVASIEVTGLHRLSEQAVLLEFGLKVGEMADLKKLQKALQRVRNLRVVRTAFLERNLNAEGQWVLKLDVDERWSIIPVMRFGGGGGSNFFVLGAYDLNFLGRLLEVGSQYHNDNGRHGGILWFRDPLFWQGRAEFDLSLGSLASRKGVYGKDSQTQRAPLPLSQVDRRDTFLKSTFERSLSDSFSAGVGVKLSQDQWNSSELSRKRTLIPLGFLVTWDRVRVNNYLWDGFKWEMDVWHANRDIGSEAQFVQAISHLSAYSTLFGSQTSAVRWDFGFSKSDSKQEEFQIGGRETVRGFFDGELRGTQFWAINAEHRMPFVEEKWSVLQAVAFVDAAQVGSNFSALFHRRSVAKSAGGGLRVLVPPVARLNLRLDVAKPLWSRRKAGIVFGMQQFF